LADAAARDARLADPAAVPAARHGLATTAAAAAGPRVALALARPTV
jgi:hypothetical protein